MKITKDQVATIARLARLAPSEEQLDRFARQVDGILDYMDVLNGLDTTGVEPLYSPVDVPSPLRADEACARRTREEILANAPEADGTFFVVPRIV